MIRRFLAFGLASSFLLIGACSVFQTRPVQDMSDTGAALRAAKEVQADTLAPELFRQANEWFFRARNEYKFKNFSLAKEYAYKARHFAEQAEFESIRNGGVRSAQTLPDPMSAPPSQDTAPAPVTAPYEYPTPTGTPVDVYDQRVREEAARNAPPAAEAPTPAPAQP